MQNIVAIFKAPGFTAKHFDQVWDGLRAAGHAHPKGLLSHVGFERSGSWMVVDIWESEEAFSEFGKTLMPIIQKTGVQVPQPEIFPAHYVLIPQHESMPA